LKKVKGLVIHWFADPMAKATNVIKWWQGQANGIAAHDVICLDGTLYHAVPYNVMAYQVGCPRGYTKDALSRLSAYPNDCVVGVECAHLDDKGTMTPETYATLVQWAVDRIKEFNLTVDELWLHSEIVGKDYKDCHRWFTTTKPEDWIKFKKEVNAILHPAPAKPAAQDTAEKYKVIKKIDGYSTAADAKTKNHKETTVIPGTYYVFNKSNGMINVTNKQGVPGSWINPGDNKEIKQEFYPIEKGDNFWILENKFKLEHGTLQKLNPKVNLG
jgi:N-acetylmuramoyl-L-alanine amidase